MNSITHNQIKEKIEKMQKEVKEAKSNFNSI